MLKIFLNPILKQHMFNNSNTTVKGNWVLMFDIEQFHPPNILEHEQKTTVAQLYTSNLQTLHLHVTKFDTM